MSRLRNTADAVKTVNKVVSRLVLQNDLWITEKGLNALGLLTETGAVRSKPWLEIRDGLQQLIATRSSSSQYFSESDTSKRCRQICSSIQLQQPTNIKLGALKRIDNSTQLIANWVIHDKADDIDVLLMSIQIELVAPSDLVELKALVQRKVREFWTTISQTSQKPLKDVHKQHTYSLDESSETLDEAYQRNMEALHRMSKCAIHASILHNQLLETEGELFEILEGQIRSDAIRTDEAPSPLPLGPTGSDPMHICFMMGLNRTGRTLIERLRPAPAPRASRRTAAVSVAASRLASEIWAPAVQCQKQQASVRNQEQRVIRVPKCA